MELIRRLAAPVYLPVITAYFGLGMLVVALPLYLTAEDLGLRTTSIVLAAAGAGAAVGSMPVGGAIARFGERRTATVALVAMAIAALPLAFSSAAVVLVLAMFGNGLATVAFLLSIQTFVTRTIPVTSRGRALSYVGGSFRFAFLLGPLAGGALVDGPGFRTTFLCVSAFMLLGAVPMLRAKDPLPATQAEADEDSGLVPLGIRETTARHRRLVISTGIAQLLVMLVREGRLVILPLISDDLGLSAAQTGAVVAASTAADLLLFPFAGWVMDRFGRLYAMVPSFALFTVGLVLLGLAETTTPVVVAGVVIGIGNGLGSGTMLTLASDLAPPEAPGPFLAIVAAIRNVGRIVGPLAVGFVGDLMGLDGAAFVLAFLMVIAVAWIVLILGETRRV